VPGATVMSFQFQFRAGNRYTLRYKNIYETAHIMEHMAFGANAQFTKTSMNLNRNSQKTAPITMPIQADMSMVYVADCADFEWERIFESTACMRFVSHDSITKSSKPKKGNVR
jgi:predicted Zn-dependent peptidase